MAYNNFKNSLFSQIEFTALFYYFTEACSVQERMVCGEILILKMAMQCYMWLKS